MPLTVRMSAVVTAHKSAFLSAAFEVLRRFCVPTQPLTAAPSLPRAHSPPCHWSCFCLPCLPGQEARPQCDAISPRLHDQEVAQPWGGADSARRAGDKGTHSSTSKEVWSASRQTRLIVIESSAISSRAQEGCCFYECSSVLAILFFFFLKKRGIAVQGLR